MSCLKHINITVIAWSIDWFFLLYWLIDYIDFWNIYLIDEFFDYLFIWLSFWLFIEFGVSSLSELDSFLNLNN